jgi:uncharacterized protein YdiU (UPF0061 family)
METTTAPEPLPLENTYARLPESFYARVEPTPVPRPALVRVNRSLAEELGLDADALASPRGVEILAGNRVPEAAEPLAMAYAGHQFGHFVPTLGDGRAVLLGEIVDREGRRHDIHLKGAGRTPFSRMGDGRAGLGPVLREYVVSEAMAGLGIPTTRSLAMVTTGETIYREQGVEPGAVLARVATSHVRVGTFEYFARRGEVESVRRLADYVIERLYPEAAAASVPHRALLEEVIRRQADLVARWMLVGFIHGVMNTDNMSIAGETIDYGPCAFMDAYHPGQVYSSIDVRGRYAYDQQPRIAHWNLVRLAETLLPLLGETEDEAVEVAQAVLADFPSCFEARYHEGLLRKLGIAESREGDAELAGELLAAMAEARADFTRVFRGLVDRAVPSSSGTTSAASDRLAPDAFFESEAFERWAERWRARLATEGGDPAARRAAMRAANPAFIPRNHRVQQVIEAAVRSGGFEALDELLAVVTRPYEDHFDRADLARPPEPHEVVHRTYCGT